MTNEVIALEALRLALAYANDPSDIDAVLYVAGRYRTFLSEDAPAAVGTGLVAGRAIATGQIDGGAAQHERG